MLELQRALQNQLNAENSLVDAVNAFQTTLDDFKITLGMPVRADLQIIAVELNVTTPDLDSIDAAELAIAYRLDLQTSRDRIDDARRQVSNAKNGLLPDLNLTGDGIGSLDNSFTPYAPTPSTTPPGCGSTGRSTASPSATSTAAPSSCSSGAPIAPTSNSVTRSLPMCQVVRSIRLATITLEIQKRSVDLNRRRLEFANERFLQGKAPVLDVVDAQSALLNAQDAYERARANLQTQVLNYLRDTGTLRLNDQASVLSRAMDRQFVADKNRRFFDEIDRKLNVMETP